jgi:hypothetical protein
MVTPPLPVLASISLPNKQLLYINKRDIFLQYSGRETLMCYQALPIKFISAHLYMDKYERKPGAKL